MPMAERLIVGPFNRVEGDLEVRLDVADGAVRRAEVSATMYRGFEQILPGRAPADALVVVPRICGICSVSQSVAAARALAALAGVVPPPNGEAAQALMLGTENVADHLTHFALFFMPDFAREVYAGRPWHAEAVRRYAAGAGDDAREATAARQRWMTMMGWLGGRWPHTGSVMPGGSSRAIEATERLRLRARVDDLRAFLERVVFAAPLDEVLAIPDEDALRAWAARAPLAGGLRLFLAAADDLGLHALGRGPGSYLAYGGGDVPAGVWRDGGIEALDLATIGEDVTHAWFDGDAPLHPAAGRTTPWAGRPGAYTWNKAPRLGGRVVETGAIARRLMAGQPLVVDLVARHGGCVLTRVVARLLELAGAVQRMRALLDGLQPGEPWCVESPLPDAGAACGLAEAARGALGHWVSVRDGRIAHYQIVAPTSWNFSPRDAAGTPGALEAALVGAPVRDGETTPVSVQHVVRSFDPCMVCTVH